MTIELDNIRVTRMVARMLKRKKCKKRNEIKKPMVFLEEIILIVTIFDF